jgi:hypothetical protein
VTMRRRNRDKISQNEEVEEKTNLHIF